MPVPNDPCRTVGGGGLHIGKLRPYPNLANKGDYWGFAMTSAISLSQIVSEYGCQVRPSSQVTVVLSPNRVGLVATGMWSEEVWLLGTFSPKRMLLRARSSSVASYAPVCVSILRGTPCRPSRKVGGEECKGVKWMRV